MADSETTQKGLVIAISEGWFHFSETRSTLRTAGGRAEKKGGVVCFPMVNYFPHTLRRQEHHHLQRFLQLSELEVSCLGVCAESRRKIVRKVWVKARTPRTLWTRADSIEPDLGVLGTLASLWAHMRQQDKKFQIKVPSVRVYSITWEIDVPEVLFPGFQWPEGVKEFHFLPNVSVKNVTFPQTLEILKFGNTFNQSLAQGQVQWPPKLKRIFFGSLWNQPMHGARDSWPASLEELHFGCFFDKPLAGDSAGLPRGLRKIVLGVKYDQPLVGIEWPPGLQSLKLSHVFNQSLSGIVFPASLKEIVVGSSSFTGMWPRSQVYGFNQPIDSVAWPVCLQRLDLHGAFNQPIENVVWPDSIRCLSLGPYFNQPINRVKWSASLQELSFGHSFNQPIERVIWPVTLQKLSFGYRFNCSLEGVAWPTSQQQLGLGSSFNRRIDNVSWPTAILRLTLGYSFDKPIEEVLPSLEELCFGDQFNQPIEGVTWPGSLRRIIFPDRSQFNHGVAGVSWPCRLEELRFGDHFNQPLEGSSLPESLREIRFGQCFAYSLQGVLPNGIRKLTFSKSYPMSHAKGLLWPPSLMVVEVGSVRFTSRENLLAREPRTLL